MSSCPLCRTKLPSTAEQIFAYSPKNANKGMAFAIHAVGAQYEVGKRTKNNLKEAAKWFKKVMDAGHPWSPSLYGMLLEKRE
jgi:TPR repeat protein